MRYKYAHNGQDLTDWIDKPAKDIDEDAEKAELAEEHGIQYPRTIATVIDRSFKEEDEPTLDSYSVKELKVIATDLGIEVPKKAKKADIIALIEEAD